MRTTSRCLAALLLISIPAGSACRTSARPVPQIIQPGAPGASSRVVTAEAAASGSHVQYTPDDVKFMQGMIHHHAQALDMTALVAARTTSADLRKLALRIEVSQADEIEMMRRWLRDRGQQIPGPHAHHAPGAPLMPGMLTPDEMTRLAEANGAEFDRLFLEGMIRHHAGALTMVQELFSTAGAGQESEIFAFATDVDVDQRMEIDRMESMLRERQK